MKPQLTTIVAALALSGCGGLDDREAERNATTRVETEQQRKAAADAEAAELLGLEPGGNDATAATNKGQSDEDGAMDTETLDLVTDM